MLTAAANKITELLGDKAEYLLNHECKTISKDKIHLPGPDFVDRIWIKSDRNPQVLRNLQLMYNTGRLANTGYFLSFPLTRELNIVPVHHLQKIQFILILKILLSWQLKAAAMLLLPLMAA